MKIALNTLHVKISTIKNCEMTKLRIILTGNYFLLGETLDRIRSIARTDG